MTVPPFLRAHADAVYLAVKVQPRASRNEIGEVLGNELKVKVTAPPVDSAANEALIEFLADELGCSKSALQIARGVTSRHKTIVIRGVAVEVIASRFARPPHH